MNAIKMTAVALIVAGLLSLGLRRLQLHDRDPWHQKIGPIELKVTEKERVNIPVWAGVAGILIGGALLLLPARRKLTQQTADIDSGDRGSEPHSPSSSPTALRSSTRSHTVLIAIKIGTPRNRPQRPQIQPHVSTPANTTTGFMRPARLVSHGVGGRPRCHR